MIIYQIESNSLRLERCILRPLFMEETKIKGNFARTVTVRMTLISAMRFDYLISKLRWLYRWSDCKITQLAHKLQMTTSHR